MSKPKKPQISKATEHIRELTAHATLLRRMGHSQMAEDIDAACSFILACENARAARWSTRVGTAGGAASSGPTKTTA